jgi:histidinol-phosphatase
MNPDWRTRYDLAVEAARKAGDLARTYFETTFAVETKADNSPVTIADKNAESLIREMVSAAFPGDGFLGEEFGDQPGTTGFRWVIDPIDGTKMFIRGVPLWGTLVGLEYRGEQIAGVCYAPGLGQLWRALRGDGAYRDDRKVRVSDVAEVARGTVCYTDLNWFRRHARQDAFLRLSGRAASTRGFGDWYGFALVAQGSVEAIADCGLHPWDAAAVKVLVEEAGGRFTDWDDTPTIHRPDVLATNGKVHAEALSILRTG